MKCQSEKCRKEFKGEPHDDPSLCTYVVVCPMCGAKHVQVEDISLPKGPMQLRFELCTEPATDSESSDNDAGYDHGNG